MDKKTVPVNTGDIILYENDGAPVLALVRAQKGERFTLLNERGREASLPANRLYNIGSAGGQAVNSADQALSTLKNLRAEAEKKSLQISVETVWESVVGDLQEYTDTKLAELYFGSVDTTSTLAMRLALLKDRIFFQRLSAAFLPRTKEHAQELRNAEAAKKRKDQLVEQFIAWCKARLKEAALPLPDDLRPFLTLLEDAAALGNQHDGKAAKEAQKILATLASAASVNMNLPQEKVAFDVLRAINYFSSKTNLAIIRHRPTQHWSDEALSEASKISLQSSLNDPQRVDLTKLPAVTIDDASTSDIDDAITLIKKDNSYELLIHISDVASIIGAGTALDREAKKRGTSIYCPDITVPMFPASISEDIASLCANQERPALTAVFDVGSNYKTTFQRIIPSKISVSDRLTYEAVDALLEKEDPFFNTLYNIATSHEEERIANGAARVEKRDVTISEGADTPFIVTEVDETAPARLLVSEMMVLYNRAVAHALKSQNIPAPFRSQEAPEDRSEPKAPHGPAYDHALKTRLKRSLLSTTPRHHYTLGLNAYTQSTSPIRRYLDLAVQRQLHALLKGAKPSYDLDSLKEIMKEVEEPLANANIIMRESKRFWVLRYLEYRAKKNQRIAGTIVKMDPRSTLVELDEVFITAPLRTSGFKKNPSLGESVALTIQKVDPQTNYLKLEVA
jgi:exoribonuclease-2